MAAKKSIFSDIKDTAKPFAAVVTIDKTYNRRTHLWDLDMHVNSSSGLPYAVRTLHASRRGAGCIKSGKLYKIRGHYWVSGDCSIDFLSGLAELLAIKKIVMREMHAMQTGTSK